MTNFCHALLLPYNTEIEELKKEKVKLKMILDEAEQNSIRQEVENVNLNKQYKLVADHANKIENHYKNHSLQVKIFFMMTSQHLDLFSFLTFFAGLRFSSFTIFNQKL